MNAMKAASTVLGILTQAGALEHEASTFVGFVTNAVTLAQGTGKTGADKLTAVLNGSQVFLAAALPHLGVDFEAMAAAISAFVGDLVAIYNEVGLFTKGVGAIAAALA